MRHARAGLTVVEALVATAMMGVAGGLLAAAFTVAGSARRTAARDAFAAIALRERIAILARRPCSAPDTSAVESLGVARVTWSAHRIDSTWHYSDSVTVGGAAARARDDGTVPCG